MKNRKLLMGIGLFLLFIIIYNIFGNIYMEKTIYKIREKDLPENFDGYKIVQISDLHNREFGELNSKLFDLIKDENPDLIVITGDLFDSSHSNHGNIINFLKNLGEISNIVYVMGNHELWMGENFNGIEKDIRNLGIKILNDESIDISRDGEKIQLIGLDDPSLGERYVGSEYIIDDTLSNMKLGGGYKILLSHRPEVFNIYEKYGMDLVLSGHVHGGQFRLPFLGGLFGPNQGFFPKYDGGMYEGGKTKMIVSRGLGNSVIPFRINNRPELVVIILERDI